MAEPAESENQNLLPVQAYFSVSGEFQTFIGQGQPFYATVNPSQSGLNITNSTINSSTIGAVSPSTGVFTNVSATTGTIATAPTANIDIANKQYVDAVAQGLNPKQAVKCATTVNITLSGLQTIDTYTTLAGDRVLVKNQSTASENGIYVAGSSTWLRATDMDTWSEVPGAYTVILYGNQAQTGWVSTSADTGTINVTAITFVQFSGSATYYAGTGLNLAANTFSIANTGVTAATKGSASKTVTAAVNAQGQLTSLTDQDIAIANTQVSGLGTMSTQNANAVAITGGTIDGATIGGTTAAAVTGTTITANTQFTGSGAGLTGTAASLSIGGNAATATSAGSATTATNLAGGAAGSVPYQASSGSTSMLAAGSNGQVLTLASGIPSWATPTVGTVTSVSGTGTVSGISLSGTVTSSGSLTLGGTLNLSSPPTIGNTTPNTGAFTSVTGTLDATFNGITVGKGANSISNNTVVGLSALDHITTGQQNTAMGSNALTVATTANNQTAFGYLALRASNGADNSAFGSTALQNTSSGSGNVAMGFQALTANTSGSSNTALGRHALITNSTGSNLTALGNHAGAYETGSNALYIDAIDRTNTAGDKAGALLYGTFSATPSSQTLTINGQVTLPYQLNLNAALALTGSTGTTGQVLTSAGSGTPTWTTPTAYATVTDDTTTNATRYPLFAATTAGNLTTEYVSSTKYQFNPSTGVLTATQFSGSGAGLTSIPNSALTNSSVTIGSTSVALGATVTTFAGLTSVTSTTFVGALSGNASTATSATSATNATNTAVTDDTTTNATFYPTFVSNTTGNLPQTVSSTKLKFNPSTGALTVSQLIIAP